MLSCICCRGMPPSFSCKRGNHSASEEVRTINVPVQQGMSSLQPCMHAADGCVQNPRQNPRQNLPARPCMQQMNVYRTRDRTRDRTYQQGHACMQQINAYRTRDRTRDRPYQQGHASRTGRASRLNGADIGCPALSRPLAIEIENLLQRKNRAIAVRGPARGTTARCYIEMNRYSRFCPSKYIHDILLF